MGAMIHRDLLLAILLGACSPATPAAPKPQTCEASPEVVTPTPYVPSKPAHAEYALVADPYSLISGRACDCNAPIGIDPCFAPESCECWCMSSGADLSPAVIATLRSSY